MIALRSVSEKNWFELQKKVQQRKIAEAFELLRGENIEPILIKGWAIARLYPPEKLRPFGDIDLCIEPKLFSRAQKLLETEKAMRLNIDLHCGLRHLDTVEWSDLFENSKLIEIEGQTIRVLREEDHLRVLCVHWLTDGGVDKEKLWDIYYVFKTDLETFDWDRCLSTVSERRRRWIICTIGLAEKYLPISLVGTPFESENIDVPKWLIKAVEKEWQNGVRLEPLHSFLSGRKGFFQQIRKRFPPNPLQSTIGVEGSFDSQTRVFYQFKDVFMRTIQSLKWAKTILLRGIRG